MPTGNGDVKRSRYKRSVTIDLPIKALSTNKMYAGVKRRSWHYKKYRSLIFEELKEYKPDNIKLEGNLTLKVEVGFSSPLSDLSNCLKAFEDCISEHFGFNDRQVVHIELDKWLVNKGSEFIKATIGKSRKNIDRRNKNGKKVSK